MFEGFQGAHQSLFVMTRSTSLTVVCTSNSCINLRLGIQQPYRHLQTSNAFIMPPSWCRKKVTKFSQQEMMHKFQSQIRFIYQRSNYNRVSIRNIFVRIFFSLTENQFVQMYCKSLNRHMTISNSNSRTYLTLLGYKTVVKKVQSN